MAEIINHTPFVASCLPMMDQHGRHYDILVLKATFIAAPGNPIRVASNQLPIYPVDEYYGDPEKSSVRYDSDMVLEKPKVDIIVNGTAVAPIGRQVQSIKVVVEVGDIEKILQVTGDRKSMSSILGFSDPASFKTMPVVYERAQGGCAEDGSSMDLHNPVGVGYKGAASQDPDVETEVPNIEYGSRGSSQHGHPTIPAGLGVVARNWQPRLSYAGTFDAEWQRNKWPLLPDDFDNLHFQAAPLDQQSNTIRGGESVRIRNMSPGGIWESKLPRLTIPVRLRFADHYEDAVLKLDTVLLEPSRYAISLTARTSIPAIRNLAPLEEIILGHATRGWWRAYYTGREYLDTGNHGGRDLRARNYRV